MQDLRAEVGARVPTRKRRDHAGGWCKATVAGLFAVAFACLCGACSHQPRPDTSPPSRPPQPTTAAVATTAPVLPPGFASYSAEAGDAGVVARRAPDPGAEAVKSYAARNPFGVDRESFGVLATTTGADGTTWLEVQLPELRPNGSRGWIRADSVTVRGHNQRIDVDLAGRTATLSDSGREVLRFPVGIGKDETPTPVGDFYVWTKWTPEQGSPATYGPGVLGLSAMSEAIDRWHGSDPLIGMHGAIRSSDLANAVSNGCIRMAPDVTTRLLADVELGTPVHIH